MLASQEMGRFSIVDLLQTLGGNDVKLFHSSESHTKMMTLDRSHGRTKRMSHMSNVLGVSMLTHTTRTMLITAVGHILISFVSCILSIIIAFLPLCWYRTTRKSMPLQLEKPYDSTANDIFIAVANPSMPNFLELPSEIRVKIYRELAQPADHMRLRQQTLRSDVVRYYNDPDTDWQAVQLGVATETHDIMLDATKLLRSQGTECDYAGFDMVSTNRGAPILQASRQLRPEAEWEFSSIATIHLSISPRLPLDLRTLPWLRQVRYLSVDYSCLSSNRMPSDRNHNWRQVDQDIAAFIGTVCKICESLRTFTLHILGDRCCDCCRRDFMHDALQTFGSPGATADALSKLVPMVRDLFTIVAFGSCYSYYELRNAISAAQPRGFACGRLDKWPAMKLNLEQRAANDLVWQVSSHVGKAAIHAWFFKMSTSNMADRDLVPSWHFLGRHELYVRDREVNEGNAMLWQEDNLEQTLLLRSQNAESEDDSDNKVDEGNDKLKDEDFKIVQDEDNDRGDECDGEDPMSQSAIAYMDSFF